jgi:predicted ATP-grasp superfamily ATP-dependent carboligase
MRAAVSTAWASWARRVIQVAESRPNDRVILVTDADQRAALAVVRSLGRAGYHVLVGGPRRRSLATASRYCRGFVHLPDALEAPAQFAEATIEAIGRHGVSVLIPISEPSLLAILAQKSRLGACLLPFPDLMTFQRVCDKAEVLRLAADEGIAIPAQAVLSTFGEPLPPELPPFPLVIKPSRSVATVGGTRSKHAVRHIANRRELDEALAAVPPSAYPLILQQRIVGPGTGIFLLVWNGKVRAVFAHRRLREKPPSGGVSVYRESVAADPLLVERSRRLLARLDWQGVAMVEYKLDGATGTPYLMEINGRFWGSLQLAIDAGVDFPRLLLEVATGGGPASPPAWIQGVRSRWWWGEVDHLLALFRRSPAALALPPGHPGPWATLGAFFVPSAKNRNETLQLDDPKPFLIETLEWFRGR